MPDTYFTAEDIWEPVFTQPNSRYVPESSIAVWLTDEEKRRVDAAFYEFHMVQNLIQGKINEQDL